MIDYEECVPKRHRACVVCWWGLAVVWVLVLCVWEDIISCMILSMLE
jgi:hypothetical protein